MKLISLSEDGIAQVKAVSVRSEKFGHNFYSVNNGVVGKEDCWQIRLPIPVSLVTPGPPTLELGDRDFYLVDLKKKDGRGQSCYMLERGHADGSYLVLLEARRTDSVDIAGNIRILPAIGNDFYNKYLMLKVEGKCWVRVTRVGRIKDGEAKEFLATYIDGKWDLKRRFIFE